jgi:hypothetical protein
VGNGSKINCILLWLDQIQSIMEILSEIIPLIIECTEIYVYVYENYQIVIDWTKLTMLYSVLLFNMCFLKLMAKS